MKTFAIIFGMIGLTQAAYADAQGFQMQTFLRCTPTHRIPDAGIEVSLRQERVGSYKEASVTHISIAGAQTEMFENLMSRPQIIQGDEAVGTIYTAGKGRHRLELVVDYTRRDGDRSPAVLELDGQRSDLTCQHFMMLM